MSRLPYHFVETLQAPMQAVGAVVLREPVVDTVQRKSRPGDPVSVAANEGTEIGIATSTPVRLVNV